MAAKAPKKSRRLKVFQAVFGFHESVVAAPSQAAALSAWGAHQNLFAEGAAYPATDEDAVAAALAHPLTPLRRAIGGKGAFGLEASAPSLDIARRSDRKPGRAKTPPSSRPEPPPPDRTALAAAEAAVERLEKAQARKQQVFRRRREALDAEEAEARTQWALEDKATRKTLERERKAYRKAVDEA